MAALASLTNDAGSLPLTFDCTRMSLLLHSRLIVADLEPADLLAVADLPEAQDSLILNMRSADDRLRQENCRANVVHIVPNWAMRSLCWRMDWVERHRAKMVYVEKAMGVMLILFAVLIVTGGLHEDGFADTADIHMPCLVCRKTQSEILKRLICYPLVVVTSDFEDFLLGGTHLKDILFLWLICF